MTQTRNENTVYVILSLHQLVTYHCDLFAECRARLIGEFVGRILGRRRFDPLLRTPRVVHEIHHPNVGHPLQRHSEHDELARICGGAALWLDDVVKLDEVLVFCDFGMTLRLEWWQVTLKAELVGVPKFSHVLSTEVRPYELTEHDTHLHTAASLTNFDKVLLQHEPFTLDEFKL